jgi:hypothetical protein
MDTSALRGGLAILASATVIATLTTVTSGAITPAQITPGEPFTVSPSQGAPFTEVTASGANCPPAGASVAAELEDLTGDDAPGGTGGIPGAFIGFFTTPDAGGNWSGTFTIPPIVTAGQYRVVARCTETDVYGPQPFEVLPGELASISVSPTRATAGTDVVLNVSGTLCRGADAQVDVRIERAVGEEAAADDPVAREFFTPDSAGSWSGQITIPATTPPGTYLVGAQCFVGGQQFFIYLPPPTIELAAVPAQPVPAPARFTG